MNKFSALLIMVLVGTFLFANLANASFPNWGTKGLVTCSGAKLEGSDSPLEQCTSFCDILATGKNILEFVVTIALFVLAPIFIIMGGFMIAAGGANPGMHSRGVGYLKTTVIGIIIILLSFVLVNTFISALGLGGKNKDGESWIKGFSSPLQCEFPTK